MPTPAYLYILRLQSGGLYIGVTQNHARRWKEHVEAHGSGRTTANDPPQTVVYSERHPTFSSARHRECQLKRWSRAKKEALIAGDLLELRRLSRRRE